MMSPDFSGLHHRLNFQPNRINGLAEFWEAALTRPCEFSTQSDQWFSGNLTTPRFQGPAICAHRFGGAHRLVHPAWGFRPIRRKPAGQAIKRTTQICVVRNHGLTFRPVESRTQNCVVWNQGLTGSAPHGGAKPLRRAARRVNPTTETINGLLRKGVLRESRETRNEKRRDVLALLNLGDSQIAHLTDRDVLSLLDASHRGIHLTDREIARRAGVSPQTVGNTRRGR